ncbi:head-tail joining protein [Novosphingobium sp. YAF33]|uniref:head-tail joining protein n=1 Tax=Novosphingobium sp. YAF33 TaxID=3233082 RepID=UPI003F9BE66C
MNPFAAALDALFYAPGSAAAVYVSPSGEQSEIRVIERQRIGSEGTVRNRPVSVGKVFDVRVSDVAAPEVGAVFLLDGRILVLTLPPELDAEGLTWFCDLPGLDRDLEILGPTRAKNEYGDLVDTFGVIMTLPAARLDRSGTESDQTDANQVAAWQQATFFIPWSEAAAAITPAYQLREGGRTFDIQTVAQVGTRAALEITGIAKAA